MVTYPSYILTAISIFLAVILFVLGGKYILEYKNRSVTDDGNKYTLTLGIVIAVAGVVVLICMDTIMSFVTYAIGAIVVISGIMKIENALDLKKMNRNWKPLLVIGIICALLGISVLLMPMNNNDDGTRTAGEFFVQCAGVVLALTGIVELITTAAVSGKIKEFHNNTR